MIDQFTSIKEDGSVRNDIARQIFIGKKPTHAQPVKLLNGDRADEIATNFVAWKLLKIEEQHALSGSREMRRRRSSGGACSGDEDIGIHRNGLGKANHVRFSIITLNHVEDEFFEKGFVG